MENLSPNKTIGRYRILSLLGEGGMGAVYKARDLSLDRDVAIKVMHPHFARQAGFQERFQHSARFAARLNHPGIVQVFDFDQQDGQLYIVMEFVPGANLGQIMTDLRGSRRWIALPEAVEVMRQVALALDYVHSQGVLHRDIKPDNIMFKPTPLDERPYRPVIIDLGLARLAAGKSITEAGVSMGTPAYISPEQALGKDVDTRSDVYSLGVLLFELATGQPPFPAGNMLEAIRYHTQQPPPAPRSLRPDLPEALEAVILQALQKDPQARFPTAGAFAEALGALSPALTLPPEDAPGAATATQTGGPGETIGLVTQLQKEPPAPRGSSLIEKFEREFGAAPASGPDLLQIMTETTTSYSVSISKPSLVIGRGEECDVPLRGGQVSRQHARLSLEGGVYRVTDLNSTNGTYLDNTRLLPGVSATWDPERVLRIGEHWLRLLRPGYVPPAGEAPDALEMTEIPGGIESTALAEPPPALDELTAIEAMGAIEAIETPEAVDLPPEPQAAPPRQKQQTEVDVWPPPGPTAGSPPDGQARAYPISPPEPERKIDETMPDLRPLPAEKAAPPAPVSLHVENPHLSAAPGSAASTTITVRNQGNLVEHFQLKVEGLPPGWVELDSEDARVFPGGEETCTLTLRPPREPGSRAGQHRFSISASGQSSPRSAARASASLTVLPFSQYTSEMHPEIVQSGKPARVTVRNQGNQPEVYTLTLRDPGDELSFRPPRVNLTVPEGQSAAVEFHPAPRAAHWFGGERSYAFSAEVAAPDGAARRHNGEFISRARISLLALVGLLAACGVLSVGAVLAVMFLQPQPPGTGNLPIQNPPILTPGLIQDEPTATAAIATATAALATDAPTAAAPTAVPTHTLPVVTVAPPPVDFSGTWLTNFAVVQLTQNGDQVQGSYTWYGNPTAWDIRGTVRDRELSGVVGSQGNSFRFVLSQDGRSFDGSWGDPVRGHWCGVRSGPLPDGCGFSGHWNSISERVPAAPPTADIVQTGDQVTGTFFNGEAHGTLTGKLGLTGDAPQYTVQGEYSVGGYTNAFRWDLLDFNSRQFEGFWVNDAGRHRWCGWRDGENRPGLCP